MTETNNNTLGFRFSDWGITGPEEAVQTVQRLALLPPPQLASTLTDPTENETSRLVAAMLLAKQKASCLKDMMLDASIPTESRLYGSYGLARFEPTWLRCIAIDGSQCGDSRFLACSGLTQVEPDTVIGFLLNFEQDPVLGQAAALALIEEDPELAENFLLDDSQPFGTRALMAGYGFAVRNTELLRRLFVDEKQSVLTRAVAGAGLARSELGFVTNAVNDTSLDEAGRSAAVLSLVMCGRQIDVITQEPLDFQSRQFASEVLAVTHPERVFDLVSDTSLDEPGRLAVAMGLARRHPELLTEIAGGRPELDYIRFQVAVPAAFEPKGTRDIGVHIPVDSVARSLIVKALFESAPTEAAVELVQDPFFRQLLGVLLDPRCPIVPTPRKLLDVYRMPISPVTRDDLSQIIRNAVDIGRDAESHAFAVDGYLLPANLPEPLADTQWIDDLVKYEVFRRIQCRSLGMGFQHLLCEAQAEFASNLWMNPRGLYDKLPCLQAFFGVLKGMTRNIAKTVKRQFAGSGGVCLTASDVWQELPDGIDTLPDESSQDLLSKVVRQESVERLRDALHILNQLEYQLLHLRVSQGMSYREVGERLGLHQKTVERTYKRILKRLKAQLS